ncbi:MAG: phosphoglucosamine mutase [Coriobacteriia bacterium]|nr:phosphoglucosamine mutase [Coriobacteriia bacterium]
MGAPAPIRFGTDGWRAVIGDDFTYANVRRLADAAGRVIAEDTPGGEVLVGYDTRFQAAAFAASAAGVLAAHGLRVRLSTCALPTPALSWATDRSDAVGAIMLTASHNPARWLGLKVKTADGGSAPPAVTGRVEAAVPDTPPPPERDGTYTVDDLTTDYLGALRALVDGEAIRSAGLRVVVDPLYGAGQGMLAQVMRDLGVSEVLELHGEYNPSFGGLHPEPIPPHVDEGRRLVREGGFDAAFFTDGDADRIGAADRHGEFVNPHRIFALVVRNLVEAKGMRGAVVKTLSTSVLLDRVCQRLDLECETTPIGFKYIYERMLAGGVMIGGEESGGIGIPSHVPERDGLAMALLLTEMMAKRGLGLAELVEDLFAMTGPMEYRRADIRIEPAERDTFAAQVPSIEREEIAGLAVRGLDRRDGVKFLLPDDAWLLLRPSGTEPLVRVYAEAPSMGVVDDLLEAGRELVTGAA